MTGPLDLEGFAAWVSRPGATRAPWPVTAAGPQDLDVVTGSGTWGPRVVEDGPTGLAFDRDGMEETTTATAGYGFAPSGRLVRVHLKPCGCTVGEFCTCACDDTRDRIELAHAPVISWPPFNLRRLAEQHLTAAELDRRERGAA